MALAIELLPSKNWDSQPPKSSEYREAAQAPIINPNKEPTIEINPKKKPKEIKRKTKSNKTKSMIVINISFKKFIFFSLKILHLNNHFLNHLFSI